MLPSASVTHALTPVLTDQVLGILFEATRLVLVQKLLSSAEFKMDPMVSLYYFAPCCAIMNGICMLVTEVPRMRLAEFEQVGYGTFLINGMIAFLLNVSAVMLVSRVLRGGGESLTGRNRLARRRRSY